MSTVRHLDGVPHIVRYGMESPEEEKSWVLFWRNGVGFRVHTEHDDVRDTPFAKVWLEYLKPYDMSDPSVRKGGWVDIWNEFCDLIIGQCMPLLKELAPDEKQWVTLEDYLHTPSYDLKLKKASESADIVPHIDGGPKDKPAYEYWPTAAANIKHLPQDAQRFDAKDLIVLDKEKDWRQPPGKVRSSDGQVFEFYPCQATSQYMPEKTFSNESIDVVNAYSLLQGKVMAELNIKQLKGVVVTAPSKDIEDSSPSGCWKDEPESGYQDQKRTDDQLVGGVLLTFLPEHKSLLDLLKDENNKPTADQKEKWRSEIEEAVEHLHRCGITIGGPEQNTENGQDAWYCINRHNVVIVGQEDGNGGVGSAWLTVPRVSVRGEDESQDGKAKFERGREMDVKGIETTFDF